MSNSIAILFELNLESFLNNGLLSLTEYLNKSIKIYDHRQGFSYIFWFNDHIEYYSLIHSNLSQGMVNFNIVQNKVRSLFYQFSELILIFH